MKDALGHGSNAGEHAKGIQAAVPVHTNYADAAARAKANGQDLAMAYFQGRHEHHSGGTLKSNPHTSNLAREWERGFKINRKETKFAATMAAKRAARGY